MLVWLVGCGDTPGDDAGMDAGTLLTDSGPFDGGDEDAGADDAGPGDAGMSMMDSGAPDGGALDAGALDAGTPDAGRPDAGAPDAGRPDAGAPDAGAPDAGPGSGATCNPSAVRFAIIASGPLMVGTLCDEVVVCVRDSAEAARVMAASSRFVCSSTPETPCTGMTCSYRNPGGPSVIDAAELAEICAVTVISPTPDVACVVFP